MNILFNVTSILFFLWVTRDILYWISIWQSNKFRTDLFIRYFVGKKDKTRGNLFYVTFIKWLLFFMYFFIVFNDNYLSSYQYVIVLLYYYQGFIALKELYSRKLLLPFATFRVNLILFLSLAGVILLFSFPLMDKFYWFILVDLMIPIIVGLLVFFFAFPTEIYSDLQVAKAARKIRAYPNLIVIAVTGNKGKSETINYIYNILENKFKVIKTQNSDSDLQAIAKTILANLQYDTDILIAEMTAYNEGDITKVCELLHPQIGVITGITNIKLKNLIYELIEFLPKNGLCLFNGNNKISYSLYKRTKKFKSLYLSSELDLIKDPKNSYTNDIVALNTQKIGKHTAIDMQIKKKRMHVALHFLANIEYVLPGIFIADSLGFRKEELRRAIAILK